MAVTPYQEKQYVQSDAVTQAQQALQNQQENKPGAYQSQYQQGMDDIMGQIQNRPKFQYDVNSDALYQQVAQNYIQQGRNAMMDTMGQAATLTGGYGNSYAQMAGQQAYQGYLQGLTDLVPQYYQMALDRYQMEGDDLLDRYNLMMQQDESAYGRYQDTVNQYYANLDRLQAAYDNERDYDMWLQEFQYGKDQDQKNWDYKIGQDEAAKQKEMAELMASVGDYGPLAAYYGLTEDQVKKLIGETKTPGVPGPKDPGIDVEAEYRAMKQAGASTMDTDSYLKAAIKAGLISNRDATELRNARY